MMSRQVLHCAEVLIDIKIARPIISRSERKSMNVSRDKCHCPETLMDTASQTMPCHKASAVRVVAIAI